MFNPEKIRKLTNGLEFMRHVLVDEMIDDAKERDSCHHCDGMRGCIYVIDEVLHYLEQGDQPRVEKPTDTGERLRWAINRLDEVAVTLDIDAAKSSSLFYIYSNLVDVIHDLRRQCLRREAGEDET